jgi:excisionase family DNA binding protein
MKTHPTQFGARENTASSRQHASRLTTVIPPNATRPQPQSSQTRSSPPHQELPVTDVEKRVHAASDNAVTRGEKAGTDDNPLTVKDAAKFLGVSPQTVYLWAERKQIPHLRVMGRNIRFLKSDLETFRASFKQEMANGKTT